MVVPSFSDFVPGLRVQRSANELLATARKAHAEAALHGLTYRLNIDSEAGLFWLTVQGDPFQDADAWHLLPGSWSVKSKLSDGVHISAEKSEYDFHPDGRTEDAEWTVSNDKGDQVIVKVEGATGRVYISDEEEK